MRPACVALAGRETPLAAQPAPLPLERWLPPGRPWEVELGFGKGRYLLARAAAEPEGRFVGVEMAAKYYRLVHRRMVRRGLDNVVLLRGEALALLSTALPRGFAAAVHVYFPDPWPKSRHHRRRLFDVDTVDLVLGLLAPGGRLLFATDHAEYGEQVESILGTHPGLELRAVAGWPGGPRTNYEAKYVAAGRPIVRLEACWRGGGDGLHPDGRLGVVSALDHRG